MFRVLIFIFFFSFLVPQGFSDPSLDVSLSKNKISTDETTQLTLKIEWPKSEGTYSFGIPELPLQYLTVSNQAESQETFLRHDENWTSKIFSFELTPKEAGEGSLESFSITYLNPATGAPGQFQVSPLKVHITKSKTSLNLSWLWIVLGIIGSLGVILAILQRRKVPKAVEVSPQEKWIQGTKQRIQSASVHSDNSLTEMSSEFRKFLQEIYGIRVSSGSHTEILEQLHGKNLSSEEIQKIEKILNRIREAKFTGQKLSEIDFQMLKKDLVDFIDSKTVISSSSIN